MPSPQVEAASVRARKHSFAAWRKRQTNSAFKRVQAGVALGKDGSDAAANACTRLPLGEDVHLAGILLAEAFTPSTVRRLRIAIERLPGVDRDKKIELVDQLEKFRRASVGGGYMTIGYASRMATVRAPGFHDEALPPGVEVVRLRLHAVTPSLTVLVGAFTYSEVAGDLSPLLRADYETKHHDIRLDVPGRLGTFRTWNPVGRPRSRGTRGAITAADGAKRRACEDFAAARQEACCRWFAARFAGCFSEIEPRRRPAVRLLLTKASAPFADDPSWREAAGLWPAYDKWECGAKGWAFRIGELLSDNLNLIVAAAQQSTFPGGTNGSSAVQQFHDHHGGLVARWAAHRLLVLHSDRLAALRDDAAGHRWNRPVRDAEAFDSYLRTNGLDSDTIVSEIERSTAEPAKFLLGLPTYSRNAPALGGVSGAPEDFGERLCSSMGVTAKRLAIDTAAATSSIVASAGLRQAILNTKLQRRVLAISIAAAVIAAVSLAITVG